MVILSHNKIGDFEDWEVQSHSSTNSYICSVDREDNYVFCSCPHFIYRLSRNYTDSLVPLEDIHNHCKHLKEVLDGQGDCVSETDKGGENTVAGDRV